MPAQRWVAVARKRTSGVRAEGGNRTSSLLRYHSGSGRPLGKDRAIMFAASNVRHFANACLLWGVIVATSAQAQVLQQLSDEKRDGFVTSRDWSSISPNQKFEATYASGTLQITSKQECGQAHAATLPDNTLLSFGFDTPLALRWSKGSDAVWSASWPWPKGMMHPNKINLVGSAVQVREPLSDSGPLDGILYVNGNGLAIASYDIRHLGDATPFGSPTIALVDFSRSARLASLRLDKPLSVSSGGEKTFQHFGFNDADAVELPSGGVRFVGAINFLDPWWLIWDSQRGSHIFPKMRGWALDRAKLSPDGSHLLASRSLQASAPCGFDAGRCSIPSKPDVGPSLIMYDVATGSELWRRYEGPVYYLYPTRPVFSADGQYAVVALPSRVPKSTNGRIGVISTKDGSLLGDAETDFYGPNIQLLSDDRTLVVSTIEHVQFFRVDWAAASKALSHVTH